MLALCVLGCDRPSTETVSACKSLQRSFDLNDGERKKCLREPDYRKDLQTKRERYYSETGPNVTCPLSVGMTRR